MAVPDRFRRRQYPRGGETDFGLQTVVRLTPRADVAMSGR